jgi:zinc transport system substrate-binding protein
MKYLLSLLFIFFGMTAFAQAADQAPSVLVSIAPYKFFVEKIAGDTVNAILMVPAGASAHTYEPTPKQMIASSHADIWFTIGESFETRAIQALRSHNPGMETIDLRQGVSMITADPASGLCCCHANCQDLHIWLSARQAKIQVATIAEGLSKKYPANADLYKKNLETLVKDLDALDKEIIEILKPVKSRIILVSHPAYAYFCRDYDFKQLSIEFEGKDPTPLQLTKVLNEARAAHIDKVLVQPQYSSKGARLFAKELNAEIVVLDPYSEDYINAMKKIAQAIAGKGSQG